MTRAGSRDGELLTWAMGDSSERHDVEDEREAGRRGLPAGGAMDQIEDVVCVGRGIGAWGDMVVTLRNGEKVELRSLPEYKKCEEVIREKMYKEKIIDF